MSYLAADYLIIPVSCFCFTAIQTGGKERTTEEWGFSPPTLSRPIWMLSRRQVGLPIEPESEHWHRSKLVSELLIELYLHSGLCWKDNQSWRDDPGNQSWAWACLHWRGTTFPPCTNIYKSKWPVNSNYQPLLLFLQGKMDRTLALLQNADPADPAPDSQELIQLEGINLNAGVNLVSPPLLFSNSVSVPLPNRSLWTDEPDDWWEAAGDRQVARYFVPPLFIRIIRTDLLVA